MEALEDELSFPIFLRGRGRRLIELTPEGEHFLPIAEKCLTLLESAKNIPNGPTVTLTIGAPESINFSILLPIYKDFSKLKQRSYFRIIAQNSREIYSMVERHELDIGFSFYPTSCKNVISQPIFREKLFLICGNSGYYKNQKIHPHELKLQDEILIQWSHDIKLWHNMWWDENIPPFIHIDSPSLLFNFLDEPARWAMCPESTIPYIQSNADIEIHEFAVPSPERVCYMLEHRFPNQSSRLGLSLFKKQVKMHCQTRSWFINSIADDCSEHSRGIDRPIHHDFDSYI